MAPKLSGDPMGPGLYTEGTFAGRHSALVFPFRSWEYALLITPTHRHYHLRTCLHLLHSYLSNFQIYNTLMILKYTSLCCVFAFLRWDHDFDGWWVGQEEGTWWLKLEVRFVLGHAKWKHINYRGFHSLSRFPLLHVTRICLLLLDSITCFTSYFSFRFAFQHIYSCITPVLYLLHFCHTIQSSLPFLF